MIKHNPILFNDEYLYSCTAEEIEFTLNSRKKIDRNHGDGFSEFFIRKSNFSVGFYLHTAESAFSEEKVFIKLVKRILEIEVRNLFAIPTGYDYKENNSESIELVNFYPPLIAKIPVLLERFLEIRGSMIGLYSQKYLIFSECLRCAVLDFNGYYSMIMGPRPFVEEVLETTIENSWNEVRLGTSIEPRLLQALRSTMTAYGY